MTLLERLARKFGFVTEARLRAATASYQAAAINRLTQSWTQNSYSADAQNRADLKIIRDRARELRNNNDYGKKFTQMLRSNVLGDQGINFRNKSKDPDRVVGGELVAGKPDIFANKLIEEKFYQWGRKEFCTVTGKLNWCDVQNIVLETVAVDGEILIRKIIQPSNPFGFTLQLIESDYLDDDYDQNLEGGRKIRMGIETDEWGRTIAYHLRTWNPNDTFLPIQKVGNTYRLPASEVIHCRVQGRSGSSRSISWMATAAYRLNMLGKYEEAETTAARAAACKMGFFTKTGANVQYTGDENSDGSKSMDAEPGSFEELPAGLDVKTIDWNHPNTAYQIFVKTALRGVASGLGVSYNTLANDMESVNFASGKLGLDSERDMFKAVQYWFIESFCEEVFTAWLENAFAAGALAPLPVSKFDKFNAPYFNGRRWPHVNPQQEVAAIKQRLDMRMTSWSRELAERNIDRDELFDEIAADIAAAKARGFELDAVAQNDKEQAAMAAEMQSDNSTPEPTTPSEEDRSVHVSIDARPAINIPIPEQRRDEPINIQINHPAGKPMRKRIEQVTRNGKAVYEAFEVEDNPNGELNLHAGKEGVS